MPALGTVSPGDVAYTTVIPAPGVVLNQLALGAGPAETNSDFADESLAVTSRRISMDPPFGSLPSRNSCVDQKSNQTSQHSCRFKFDPARENITEYRKANIGVYQARLDLRGILGERNIELQRALRGFEGRFYILFQGRGDRTEYSNGNGVRHSSLPCS